MENWNDQKMQKFHSQTELDKQQPNQTKPRREYKEKIIRKP